jgi:hypothetical protein
LHADHDVNWNVANTNLQPIDHFDLIGGNAINLTGGNSNVAASLNLNQLVSSSTISAGVGGINAPFVDIFYSGAELNLMSGGDITAHSIKFTDSYARGTVDAAGAITTTGDLWEGVIKAGTSLDVGGSISASTLEAGTTVTAGGYISASSITAGGDVTADNTHVQTITSPTGVLDVTNGISPNVFSTDPAFPQGAMAQHVYTVDSIVSPGGIDFSGNQFHGINGFSSGGLLTINATTLTFDPATGIGTVNFNGADAGALDYDNQIFTTVGGDGGTFIANASGDITTTSGSPISATTGQIDPNLSSATSSGAGGTVALNSTNGTVSIDSTIQVSSAEPTSTVAPFRASASGGNINISSGKNSGVAINVSNSSQLLSLLDAAAPGPGGKITILATGASSKVNVSGKIVAGSDVPVARRGNAASSSRGDIDVRHTGDSGEINLASAINDTINMRGDLVKIGALGDNGTLTIGNMDSSSAAGSISADTILALYASGSNGTLKFVTNVTLSSGTAMHLAANTIFIRPGVFVTINGNGGPANIYTNHPNYNFTPGASYVGPAGVAGNGSFTGNGAHDPVPLANAPAFNGPGVPPGP